MHIVLESESGEWKAWCCCGWESDTWHLRESAQTCAEVHMAGVNSGYYDRLGAAEMTTTPPLRVMTPSETIERLARCGSAGERFATLSREECVLLMALWTAACVMASAGTASPKLREAVAVLASEVVADA